MGMQALILGLLTVTHSVTIWEIGVLAFILGLNNAFENPARQSFMMELVGPEHLRNAVSLNSTMVNVARVVGPAVAGLMIAARGDRLVLPDQLRQLHLRDQLADADGHDRAESGGAGPTRARGSCVRACATSDTSHGCCCRW